MRQPVLSNLGRFWQGLIEPPALALAEGRQVRLLSSLLVFVIPAITLVTLLWAAMTPEGYAGDAPGAHITAGTCLLLAAAYFLNRSGRFYHAALLTIVAFSLAIFTVSLVDVQGVAWLNYLVIPILVCSVLLPVGAALAFAAVNILAMALLPAIFPQVHLLDLPIIFIFLTSGLILLVIRHRNELEQDRQQALARSEERFSKVFRSSPMAIVITTLADGRIVDANEYFARLLGYQRDELIGRKTSELNIFQNLAGRPQVVTALLQEGSMYNVETQWRTRSGEMIDIITSGELIELEGETCILGMGVDITHLKQAENELRNKDRVEIELRKERELGEVKRRFMITASHEFRTPLAIILASSELVELYGGKMTPERRATSFGAIRSQVMSLGAMLDDMRTILDVEAGSIPFDPAPFDLGRLCGQFVEEVQSGLAAKHTLVYSCEGDLAGIPIDRTLFERIVKNLLSNAIKFSPQGGEIRVHVARREDTAVLTVSDGGIGIPLKDQPRIFEANHRAENAINTPGIGMGLASVLKFVNLHSGRVQFTSEEGKGTTFTVTLPVTGA